LAVAAAIGNLGRQRHELVGLAGHGVLRVPGTAAAAGFLDVDKGEIPPAPIFPPATDQRAHQRILIDARDGRAAFALVPENAANAMRNERPDVGLVETTDSAGRLARLARRSGLGRWFLLILLGGLDILLPLGQSVLVLFLQLLQRIGGGELLDRFLARL